MVAHDPSHARLVARIRQREGFMKARYALLVATVAGLLLASGLPAQSTERYTNLRELPADISRDDLTDTMLGFLTALGLPRRAGAGCLYCHEGDLEVPRREWDYASDAKPTKRTARQMVAMVRAINAEHLSGLEGRKAPNFAVGCVTCHEGRLDPRPLPLLLAEAEAAGGVDSLLTAYRTVHSQFYGSAAYDLRSHVLAGLAEQKAEEGAFDDALALSNVNEETHPGDPSARQVTLSLHILRALDTDGPQAAVRVFDELSRSESSDILTFSVLDGVGWRTFRLDRQAEALVLFKRNREAFPDLYFTFESLVEAQHAAGEITREQIIEQYDEFLRQNPGHAMAEQQVTNHRRRN